MSLGGDLLREITTRQQSLTQGPLHPSQYQARCLIQPQFCSGGRATKKLFLKLRDFDFGKEAF